MHVPFILFHFLVSFQRLLRFCVFSFQVAMHFATGKFDSKITDKQERKTKSNQTQHHVRDHVAKENNSVKDIIRNNITNMVTNNIANNLASNSKPPANTNEEQWNKEQETTTKTKPKNVKIIEFHIKDLKAGGVLWGRAQRLPPDMKPRLLPPPPPTTAKQQQQQEKKRKSPEANASQKPAFLVYMSPPVFFHKRIRGLGLECLPLLGGTGSKGSAPVGFVVVFSSFRFPQGTNVLFIWTIALIRAFLHHSLYGLYILLVYYISSYLSIPLRSRCSFGPPPATARHHWHPQLPANGQWSHRPIGWCSAMPSTPSEICFYIYKFISSKNGQKLFKNSSCSSLKRMRSHKECMKDTG